MKECPRTLGFNQDLMNGVLQLIARQHDDVAVAVFELMQHPEVSESAHEITHARFMVKSMIKHGRVSRSQIQCFIDL